MSNSLKFGTSGLRGLATDLIGAESRRYAAAFLRYLRTRGDVGEILVGRDLRQSSPEIARSVIAGLDAPVVDCGELPTPALALEAMRRKSPAIMITGSHIPADRNGLKFYLADGEIEKADEAGILAARSLLLTTNDDAVNIYLAVFCRRLNHELRIVSRITHERNLEAIHRAGADFVLSYTTLGIEAVMSLLHGHPPVLLGEGIELFSVPVPVSLVGTPLLDSRIGSRTGLSVVALQQGDRLTAPLTSETVLPAGAHLLMLGSHEQREAFDEAFGRAR